MATIPENYRDLFEKPVTVSLATIQPDGSLQVTPVWADLEGDRIRINTEEGRQKAKNMSQRPQVTVMAYDPTNPYRYIEVRGKVVHSTTEGAGQHIDKLAKDYMGVDTYPYHQPDASRIIFYIEPEKVSAQN